MPMRAIYTRRPNDGERQALLSGLKSDRGITVRRSQIILMSADQQLKAGQIGKQLGLSDQSVRNVLHAFNERSAAQPVSSRVRVLAMTIKEPSMMWPERVCGKSSASRHAVLGMTPACGRFLCWPMLVSRKP